MKIFCCLFALASAAPTKTGSFVDDDEKSIMCGGIITDNGIITSPGFDDQGHYFNNINCSWEVNIAGVSGFMIIPEVFEVEHDDNMPRAAGESMKCELDSLSINWQEKNELKIGDDSGPDEFNYKFCSSDIEEVGSYTTEAYESGRQTQKPWHTFLFDWSTTVAPNGKIKESSSNNLKRRDQQEKQEIPSSYGIHRTYIGDFIAPVQIKGNSATIKFTTDSSVVLRGFKLRIEKGVPEKRK
ncbi:unnamed protein product [Oikopleura dioica]|uniref:CUB domain-containing protein n=1 Tax=Oikopleura dioica TaxID=34765 RepID=E4XEI4_OIKDI|nr:unnamed protein product [Oikopleura dioica]